MRQKSINQSIKIRVTSTYHFTSTRSRRRWGERRRIGWLLLGRATIAAEIVRQIAGCARISLAAPQRLRNISILSQEAERGVGWFQLRHELIARVIIEFSGTVVCVNIRGDKKMANHKKRLCWWIIDREWKFNDSKNRLNETELIAFMLC